MSDSRVPSILLKAQISTPIYETTLIQRQAVLSLKAIVETPVKATIKYLRTYSFGDKRVVPNLRFQIKHIKIGAGRKLLIGGGKRLRIR